MTCRICGMYGWIDKHFSYYSQENGHKSQKIAVCKEVYSCGIFEEYDVQG